MRPPLKPLWALPLLALLAACTGSQEPRRPALLGALEAQALRFYQTRGLPQGQVNPVGLWSFAEAPKDAAYASGRLYLLFGNRLEVYTTQGFTETQVPDPSAALQETVNLPQGCTGAYLRLGQDRLLIACQEAGRAYLWPLGGGDLVAADLTGLDPNARLALGPGDRLAYLTAQALGYRDPANQDPSQKREALLPSPLAAPKDLVFDPDTGRLWGLGADSLSQGQLYAFQTSLQGPLPAPQLPQGLALLRGRGLVAYGQGFQALDAQGSPKGGLQSSFTAYQAAALSLDGYLYLGQGSALEVWDLQPSTPTRVQYLGLPASPQALLYLPVD